MWHFRLRDLGAGQQASKVFRDTYYLHAEQAIKALIALVLRLLDLKLAKGKRVTDNGPRQNS